MRYLARWWAVLVLLAGALSPRNGWPASLVWGGRRLPRDRCSPGGAESLVQLAASVLVAALIGLALGLVAAHWQLRTVETAAAWETKRAETVGVASAIRAGVSDARYRAVQQLAAAGRR